MTIDILLSTYNSEVYLKDLFDSLFAQSYTNWRLIVRDDCSTDNTVSLLKEFKKISGKEVIFIANGGLRLGPKLSFEKLLISSSADYLMFCDHDDYWLPHKIEDSFEEIRKLEKRNLNQPVLVFTDLTVVDNALREIHSSFWKYSKINPDNIYNPYKLIINNPAPGCTFMMNKNVKNLVLPFPKQATMHDWWITLKVAEAGIVSYIDKPTILYRQHEGNKVGAEEIGKSFLVNRLSNIIDTWRRNKKTYQMMQCLDKNYSIFKLLYYKFRTSISKTF